MDAIFLTRVLISFALAGIWITLATIIAERLGTKVGGLVGNLPSNIVVSLFFIGLTQTPEFAAAAARVVPLAMVIDSVFLFIFVISVVRYRRMAFLFALASWVLLAIPLGNAGYGDVLVGAAVYIVSTLLMFLLLEYRLHIPSIGRKGPKGYSVGELLVRAVFSGGVVAGAVVLAALLGPVWGGVFSTFPAVMLSTMYLLARSQGFEFARATGKVMLLASFNIIVYGIAVSITYPAYGLMLGTIISYAAAAVAVICMYPLLRGIK